MLCLHSPILNSAMISHCLWNKTRAFCHGLPALRIWSQVSLSSLPAGVQPHCSCYFSNSPNLFWSQGLGPLYPLPEHPPPLKTYAWLESPIHWRVYSMSPPKTVLLWPTYLQQLRLSQSTRELCFLFLPSTYRYMTLSVYCLSPFARMCSPWGGAFALYGAFTSNAQIRAWHMECTQ